MKAKTNSNKKSSQSVKALHKVKKAVNSTRDSDDMVCLITRCCDQMALLLSTIHHLELKQSRSTQVHTKCLLEVRTQILQAVYDKFYMYTAIKAQQLAIMDSQGSKPTPAAWTQKFHSDGITTLRY